METETAPPEATFADLPFTIAPGRVFTPRPTTERLVRRALERIGDDPKLVADVGTGSGVIGITLAVRLPRVEVWATDVNPEAVELRSVPTPNSCRDGKLVTPGGIVLIQFHREARG
jgi:predicted RNA methylase